MMLSAFICVVDEHSLSSLLKNLFFLHLKLIMVEYRLQILKHSTLKIEEGAEVPRSLHSPYFSSSSPFSSSKPPPSLLILPLPMTSAGPHWPPTIVAAEA